MYISVESVCLEMAWVIWYGEYAMGKWYEICYEMLASDMRNCYGKMLANDMRNSFDNWNLICYEIDMIIVMRNVYRFVIRISMIIPLRVQV